MGVSHSIFTQKHQTGGDSFPNLVDTVVFGCSDNHVGLQIADCIVSGLIFPMAIAVYRPLALNNIPNGHVFKTLRTVHGPALKEK